MSDQLGNALGMLDTVRKAALEEAERETVRKIVAWLRTYKDDGLAQSYATAIERGDWK